MTSVFGPVPSLHAHTVARSTTIGTQISGTGKLTVPCTLMHGQFYEMFEKDADIGHRELHLKLTDRTNMRMCGVPEGQFANYANQLVAKGYKVVLFVIVSQE